MSAFLFISEDFFRKLLLLLFYIAFDEFTKSFILHFTQIKGQLNIIFVWIRARRVVR